MTAPVHNLENQDATSPEDPPDLPSSSARAPSRRSIYGTIRDGPNPLRSTVIEIACPDFAYPSFRVTSKTGNSGSFRVHVERQRR